MLHVTDISSWWFITVLMLQICKSSSSGGRRHVTCTIYCMPTVCLHAISLLGKVLQSLNTYGPLNNEWTGNKHPTHQFLLDFVLAQNYKSWTLKCTNSDINNYKNKSQISQFLFYTQPAEVASTDINHLTHLVVWLWRRFSGCSSPLNLKCNDGQSVLENTQ